MTGSSGGPERPAPAVGATPVDTAARPSAGFAFSARRTARRSKRTTPFETGTAGISPLLTSPPRCLVETPRYSAICPAFMRGLAAPSSAIRSLFDIFLQGA